MSGTTPIEWADYSWNYVRGCTRKSAGCLHCYAERIAARFSGPGLAYEGLARRRSNGEPQWTGQIRLIDAVLADPIRWRKPRRIFVNSMSDLFHEHVPIEAIARTWAVMALAPRHTYQILTKRPERMRDVLHDPTFYERVLEAAVPLRAQFPALGAIPISRPAAAAFYPQVWLGVSVEDQAAADERVPVLLQTPAHVRFLSCEPLLGPLSLAPWLTCRDRSDPQFEVGHGVDWVIIGGESGIGARPVDIGWIDDLVKQCKSDDARVRTAVFVKQLGAVPMEREENWRARLPIARLLDARNRDRVPEGFVPLKYASSKGGDVDEWPAELCVREFPEVARCA